jgi:hypothetical protein
VSERILLARRTSGRDYAVVLETDQLRIEGGFALRRDIPYRVVHGLERYGSWLWLGVGFAPAAFGGRDVPAERLAVVERELRTRIAALPEGAERIARLDRRGRSVRSVPWLSLGAVLAGSLALLPSAAEPLPLTAWLLLSLGFGVVVEGWLGLGAAIGSACAGLGAASVLGDWTSVAGAAAPLTPQLVSAAWIGLLGFARTLREAELPVLTRSVIDTALLIALGFSAVALASGTHPRLLLLAALGGFASAAFALPRRTTDP